MDNKAAKNTAAVKAAKPKKGIAKRLAKFGFFFCIPFVIIFLVFSVYPVFRTFQMSFMNYKGFGKETFAGFDNYVRVFKDTLFWDAFLNTLKMWGVNIVLQLGLALLLTIIFNDMKYRMRGLGMFRALFYLPNLIACTSVAFLFGSANRYLKMLDEWLEDFCSKTTAAFSNFENKQKIHQAVQYVQAHFREPLNMAEVSNRVSMNYSLFSTLFKQYTGVNFVNYLQNLRINETKHLLETTDWHIYEIGRCVGFTDDKHFLKTFKSVTGFSPTEYRKSKLLMERSDNAEDKK